MAHLEYRVPGETARPVTRGEYRRRRVAIGPKDLAARNMAVAMLVTGELDPPEKPRRSERRNFEETVRFPAQSRTIVYAFRPRLPGRGRHADWYLVVYEVAESEDFDEAEERFDRDFLDAVEALSAPDNAKSKENGGTGQEQSEQDLLREAIRRSTVNYAEWSTVEGEGTILRDDLPGYLAADLRRSATNLLPRLRRSYSAIAPSPLVDPDRIAAIRVFDRRADYLACVGLDYKWTAAVWSPLRRELIAYLPESGVEALRATLRHEAFHQYLAYAGAMITAAPWFNEGHAMLFEHSHFDLDGAIVFDPDPEAAALVRANRSAFAETIPEILKMNYDEFYAGTQEAREAKYAIVWSIAYFLQKGAPEVRFRPFENLRSDYMKALVRTRSMQEATRAVLDSEKTELLVEEWLKFWAKDR